MLNSNRLTLLSVCDGLEFSICTKNSASLCAMNCVLSCLASSKEPEPESNLYSVILGPNRISNLIQLATKVGNCFIPMK